MNYLALLGWSPGGDEELVPVDEMARRFDLATVSHSAAVFDTDKLAWINRHYMGQADAGRLTSASLEYFSRAGYLHQRTEAALGFIESVLPMAVGSVDRLEEIPDRLAFIFAWKLERATALLGADPDGTRAVAAFAREIASVGALDREAFRAAAGRVKTETGLKGRALFHPIRVALTSEDSGPELDLAVPAIDRGAGLSVDAGVGSIASCAQRAARVADALS